MPLAHKLGKRIRELRIKAGFTQDYLAEQADISSKYLSEVERGKVNISLKLLEKIAHTFAHELPELTDFAHIASKEEIIQMCLRMMESASETEIQQIFRVMKALLK